MDCELALFTVYHSNQIDLLKTLLIELIRQQPLSSPFDQEQILVQSPGMSQWLKMEMAKEMGIAANLNFPLPATFIWQMFIEVLPNVPKRSAFNKEAMTWKLMQVLPEKLADEQFSTLAAYLSQDDDHSKLYQLAGKIADIFDGYLVYRPDYITAWEDGEHPAELDGQGMWQGELWRTLYQYTLDLGQSKYHRANLYQHFIDQLTDLTDVTGLTLPKRLFVFGVSSLPPKYLEALKALGEHIDVHLMFHNPCRYYWGDIKDQRTLAKMAAKYRPRIRWQDQIFEEEPGIALLKGDIEQNSLPEFHHDAVTNNLLASLGKQGRDYLQLMSGLESHEVEAFVDIDGESLLHRIQSDILELTQHQDDSQLAHSHHKMSVMAQDSSVSVHSCHSATREVEVLYDQLLEMFNSDATLKPRDIIVMVADINAYAPAINAVFGNVPNERRIPFSISDRTATQETPILNAFLQLLDLPSSRCGRSELMELLETPAILQRFNMSASEFELVNQWVEESGVRWGLDDATAQEFELPTLGQNTWLFGLQRILLGYSMSAASELFETEHSSIAPYEQIEGMQAELAGRLASFIDKVILYRHRLSKPMTSSEWQHHLNQLVDDFFDLDIESELALKSIRDSLVALKEQTHESNYTQSLSPTVVLEYLQDRLDNTRVSQRFLAGQVNFCTLMPMRSIPFKVVCLLGMNDGAYPRTVPSEGFDLMSVKARYGDRSRRDDDRYLFLEALLSAQQTLYISYVGRSILDNSVCLPSILVTEFLDYCAQNYCLDHDESLSVDSSGERLVEQLLTYHSMTPFSREAFMGQGSFASEWLPVVNNQTTIELDSTQPDRPRLTSFVAERDDNSDLELDELQRFWALPVKHFFNQRLQVWFGDKKELIQDEEPFSFNGLERYFLREDMVDALLQGADDALPKLGQLYRSSGRLPVGNFGGLELAENEEAMNDLASEVQYYTSRKLESISVALSFEHQEHSFNLVGWLNDHYGSGLVNYRVGTIRSQDILLAWIKHLCACASGVNVTSHLLGINNKKGVEYYSLAAVDQKDAHVILQVLVSAYFDGMTQPIPYFPKSANEAMQAFVAKSKKGDIDGARKIAADKLAATFLGDNYNAGEGDNVYIQRVWKAWDSDLQAQAFAWSEKILLPAVERLQSKAK